MCSANKVSFVNAMHGAYLSALTAGDTLAIVDSCEVIDDLYCLGGTVLFTLTASDTAPLAELTHLCALIVVIALNGNRYGVVYEVDYTVGTGALTEAAADTFLGVYICDTALGNRDSITGADLGTVAVAEAGKGAESVTCKGHICRLTGLWTRVDIFSFLGTASAVTGNVCNLLNDVLCLNTENFGNFLCGTVTAGDTEVGFVGYSLGERLCVALAAREAAGAAVSTGKTVTDKSGFFVLLDSEIDRGNREKQSTECARAEKKEYGN